MPSRVSRLPLPLPARGRPEPDPVLRRDIVIGALAPPRLERELHRPGAGSGAGQAPAQAVVAAGFRQTEPDLRRAREPAAEHPEAVAEPRLQAPPPVTVVVGRKPLQGGARQQRVLAARRPRADGLAQRQLRTPARGRRAPGERSGQAAVPEARRLVGQHAPALQRDRQALRGRRQRHPAADIGAEPSLGIAAVMAHSDRQARRHRRPLPERIVSERQRP